MAVYNFYVSADIDGRATRLAAGPKAKDGGIDVEILIREKGSPSDKSIRVEGFSRSDGTLLLMVDYVDTDSDGRTRHERLKTITVER